MFFDTTRNWFDNTFHSTYTQLVIAIEIGSTTRRQVLPCLGITQLSRSNDHREAALILNYLALFMIIVVLIMLFYTFIYLHELPYEVAKHRNHPQQDAIYVACWLSLFTLHALWPFVFLWALTHKEIGSVSQGSAGVPPVDLATRLSLIEARLKQMEVGQISAKKNSGAK